jgi:RimJ/RimL family protein N-acetyltransferase
VNSFGAPLAARLEGRIVVLEPLAPEHGQGLWEAAQDPAIWQWTHAVVGASRTAFDDWWAQARAEQEAGISAPFAICSAEDGRPVGSSRYMSLRPEHRGLEIGHTWMRSSTWDTGANAEAKLLLLEHAFGPLGCMRVEFKTDAKNERARRALEALPSRFEGIFRKHMLVRDGELRDSAWYAITDDDWPEVKAGLEARVARKAGS